MSIDDCFAMEMRLAATCCDVKSHPDFVTGVKHLLVNKQKSRPGWRPSEIDEVDLAALTTKYFSNRAASSTHIVRLEGLKTQMKSYHEYPHSKYGLPSEELIKAFVTGDVKGTSGHLALTRQELLQLVLGLYNHKIGVQHKLIDVLDRRTVVKVGPVGNYNPHTTHNSIIKLVNSYIVPRHCLSATAVAVKPELAQPSGMQDSSFN
ncbi:hypothetical protein PGTUg99_020630 [Puccinia graminis f. sp. tritici]|uniref:Enoyl-CoA hydratase/isomerase domain-containing protein n=1 Tax=Puccinia graminis f. sp. tritici TaxID=56615 RepID=A0A5B0RD05_PUCGR|nr:hypothetical protein PGTUg99_020630 [Puccinia graminis f. sp. tritici]